MDQGTVLKKWLEASWKPRYSCERGSDGQDSQSSWGDGRGLPRTGHWEELEFGPQHVEILSGMWPGSCLGEPRVHHDVSLGVHGKVDEGRGHTRAPGAVRSS